MTKTLPLNEKDKATAYLVKHLEEKIELMRKLLREWAQITRGMRFPCRKNKRGIIELWCETNKVLKDNKREGSEAT